MPHDQRITDPDTHGHRARSELIRIIQNQKIPNALLFTGHPGTGKVSAAIAFAQAANCRGEEKERPCNRCPACKKIVSGMHPDMVSIALPDAKKIIPISQVREMEAAIAVKPNEARQRMVLIRSAEKMNVQAQNALLKVLEEPPDNTFFILLAPDLSGLLPTIISRCRHIRFKPLTGEPLVRHLVARYAADPRDARIAAGTAGPDFHKALMFLNLSEDETRGDGIDWQARRNWIIRELIGLITGTPHKKYEKALALSRELSLDPGAVPDGLAVMRTVLRDLCVLGYSPRKIVNLDFSDAFHDIKQMVDDNTCLKWITDLHETEKRLAANVSARLALDRFLMGLAVI